MPFSDSFCFRNIARPKVFLSKPDHRRKITAIMVAVVLAATLAGCSGKPEPVPHATPLQKLDQAFQHDRGQAMVVDGIKEVSGQTKLNTLDCMVFNRAAQNQLHGSQQPTTLGGWSALRDSMMVRMGAGCAEPDVLMADYESARRGLSHAWDAALAILPGSEAIQVKSNALGKFVEGQINHPVTDSMVCVAHRGRQGRNQGSAAFTLHQVQQRCDNSPFYYKPTAQCQTAYEAVKAMTQASGKRDEVAWTAETVERYKMAYRVCSPSAWKNYQLFYRMVPQDLFQSILFRLQKPAGPLFSCTAGKVSADRSKRYASPHPNISWNECAKAWGIPGIAQGDNVPRIITENSLRGYGRRSWLFNPKEISRNPEQWEFNKCEQGIIAYMQRAGMNPASPGALHNYCRVHPEGVVPQDKRH